MEGEVEDSQGYCLYQTEMLPERICCPVAPLNGIRVCSYSLQDFIWNQGQVFINPSCYDLPLLVLGPIFD
jgi:hypothetical protein